MPGLLKPSASCPMCGTPLICVSDLSNSETVTREYFHDKPIWEPIRKRRCLKVFTDLKSAANERSGLEIHCALPSTERRGQDHPN